MKIAFEEQGSGAPVVLLHAFPLHRKMWQPQTDAVSNAGFRLILPDLRGFGQNNSFSDINTMSDMARDVAELLDSLKIKSAIIGGLSMGGYVAFNLYRLFPEKFAALLLFDTTSAADTEEKRQARFDLIEEIERNGTQTLIEKMLPNLISEHTKTNNRELVEKIEHLIAETNPKAAIAALRGMAERQDHTHLLPKISVPTILIFGQEDKITNLEMAEKMNKAIPDSRLIRLRNAGHFSNLEQPSDFNDALIPFLKTVEI